MAWDGLVQPTGKYRSIRHTEDPKFQTRIFGRMESAPGPQADPESNAQSSLGCSTKNGKRKKERGAWCEELKIVFWP